LESGEVEIVTEDLATDDGLYWEKQQTSPLFPEVEITTDPIYKRKRTIVNTYNY